MAREPGRPQRVALARDIRAALIQYNLRQRTDIREIRPDWEDEAWDALCTAREALAELMDAELSAREMRERLEQP